jgi:hypothetical protein
MRKYRASGITLEFPDNLFDMLDRDAAEHVVKSYLEENEAYQNRSLGDRKACFEEFMDQIKPRGSCWSIV